MKTQKHDKLMNTQNTEHTPEQETKPPSGNSSGAASCSVCCSHPLDDATEGELKFLNHYAEKEILWGVFFIGGHGRWSLIRSCDSREQAECLASKDNGWSARAFEARVIPEKILSRGEKLKAKYLPNAENSRRQNQPNQKPKLKKTRPDVPGPKDPPKPERCREWG